LSRSGINYFEVAKAAAQIVGRGKTPTIELVRGLLGTGSNSTIGTHLRAWRAQQNPGQLALQADLPEELVSLMKGLWDRVTSEANSKIVEIQEAVQNEITVLKQNSQKIQQENNRYQQQNQQHKQEQDGLVQEKSALEQIIISYKTESVELKAKQEGLIQQLQEKQDRIEELKPPK
jgi:chromosome segregation ATPase